MRKRPLAVTIIGCVFVAAGLIGVVYHAAEYRASPYETVWVLLVRVAAAAFGAYMLLGRNWARWGALVWMAYHVILSAFHSRAELVTHLLLFVVFTLLLTRPSVTRYFRPPR